MEYDKGYGCIRKNMLGRRSCVKRETDKCNWKWYKNGQCACVGNVRDRCKWRSKTRREGTGVAECEWGVYVFSC